jgi:hypothetical protein
MATVIASSSVVPGTYNATITGSVGTVTATTNLQIIVNAAGTSLLSIGDATWSPNPATLGPNGALVSGNVTALISPSLLAGDSVSYTWSATQVWRADPNARTLKFTPYSGNYTIAWPSNSSAATPTFNATFYDTGDYIIQVSTTAKITHSDNSVTSISGSGYIGGSQSDVDAGAATANDVQQAAHAMDATSAEKGIRVSPPANALTIECYYNGTVTDVTNLTTPMKVMRGYKIALKALRSGAPDTSSGQWNLQGSVAGELYWILTPWGIPFDYSNYPLHTSSSTVRYIYTQTTPTGTNLSATWTDTNGTGGSHTASALFTVVDPPITNFPYKTDTKVKFRIFGNVAIPPGPTGPGSDNWAYVCTITIALPSKKQERYPFTAPPDIEKNVINASNFFMNKPRVGAMCASGMIGDYGKVSGEKFYPDIQFEDIAPSHTEMWERRDAGNFNFGAQGAAEGWPLYALIEYAEQIDILGSGELKPITEVESIKAGYNWYFMDTKQPLNGGAVYDLYETYR